MGRPRPEQGFRKTVNDGVAHVNRREYADANACADAAGELAGSPEEKLEARFLGALVAFAAGDGDKAVKEYRAIANDKTMDMPKRFEAAASIVGMECTTRNAALSLEELEKRSRELALDGLTPAGKYAALNNAAKTMTILRHYRTAREFLALADRLAPPMPRKTRLCKYMANVPPGAGGWLLSDLIKNPANRESRFEDYDKDSAAMLFSDITIERAVSADDARRARYRDETGFYMAYNDLGWHIFVLCGEPDMDAVVAENRSAGSLEMYFSRGFKGEPYSQWILRLPAGDCNSVEWNSPDRSFRPLKQYMTTETVIFGKNMGTYIFIPWEALYNKLPLDGGRWPFGFIRWTPAGGITWGGQVHEIGKWGLVEWEKPTAEQALAIKRNILRKAWSKYRADRDALAAHWADDMVGDPAFHQEVLRPAFDRLDALGAKLSEPGSPTPETVESLWESVSDWMEIRYDVAESRRKWLTIALVM